MARRGVFAFTFQSTLSSQRVTPVNGVSIIVELFQSTLSSQRVTAAIAGIIAIVKFQSTLSSQRVTTTASGRLYINIFQSTLSSQRVTRTVRAGFYEIRISIHTLLAESDSKISQMFHITHRNFAHLSHILYIYFLF